MKKIDYTKLHALYLKGEIMKAYRYCERIYDGGLDSYEQFQAFTNLCQNFVDICNFNCRNIKPTFGILQHRKWQVYKDLEYACAFVVGKLNELLRDWQATYEKTLEDCEIIKQMETRARIDHQIAIEYRESEIAKEKQRLKGRPIGYNINKDNEDE